MICHFFLFVVRYLKRDKLTCYHLFWDIALAIASSGNFAFTRQGSFYLDIELFVLFVLLCLVGVRYRKRDRLTCYPFEMWQLWKKYLRQVNFFFARFLTFFSLKFGKFIANIEFAVLFILCQFFFFLFQRRIFGPHLTPMARWISWFLRMSMKVLQSISITLGYPLRYA